VVSIPAKDHNIYIYIYPMNLSCQHVMKVSSIITVHYRNSICIITAVQTTLTYVAETTYSRGVPQKCGGTNSDRHTLRRTIYSQYNQPRLVYWQQVSHCLRNSVRFVSPSGRPSSLSWLRILTFLRHHRRCRYKK
jgi:hypothetical protein